MLSTVLIGCIAAICSAVSTTQEGQDPQEKACARLLARAAQNPRLELVRELRPASGTVFVRGTLRVFENRAQGKGREIRLQLMVLPAREEDAAPDPVFLLHGGPGAAATAFFGRQVNGWIRQKRDVVLIDQRGTGSSNALRVPMQGTDEDLQSYFTSYFLPEAYRAALPGLQRRADLSQYTTANSVDDFDEVRAALGYEKINVLGGSYGTRAALVYLRRHAETIRSATLIAVQPISYRNPLPHARSAQDALDRIFDEIRETPRYRAAFGDIEAKFRETLERLEKEPAKVKVAHPATGEDQEILLDRNAFAESVRLQLYNLPANRRLPLQLLGAHAGEYRALAEASIAMSRSVRNAIAWGMLMCVTGSEDIPRIAHGEIEAACAGTFLGEVRIREQMAIAAFWPSGTVPESFAEPVTTDVPVLLLSGSHDPSTSPQWAEEAARHMPNALHVVVPGGHGVDGPAVQRLERAFLEKGSAQGLDLSGVERLTLPPLVLPANGNGR